MRPRAGFTPSRRARCSPPAGCRRASAPPARSREAKRLPSLLPYESYDPATDIFHNDDSVGFVLEAEPAAGLSEAQIRSLSGLFTQGLRPGTSVQITLYASPDIAAAARALGVGAPRPRSRRGRRHVPLSRRQAPRVPAPPQLALAALRSGDAGARLPADHQREPAAHGGSGNVDTAHRLPEAHPRGDQGRARGRRACRRARWTRRGLVNLLDTILNPARGPPRAAAAGTSTDCSPSQMVDAGTLLLVGRDGLSLSQDDAAPRRAAVLGAPVPAGLGRLGHGRAHRGSAEQHAAPAVPVPLHADRARAGPGHRRARCAPQGRARDADGRLADGPLPARVARAQAGLGLREPHARGRPQAAAGELPGRAVRARGRGRPRRAAAERPVRVEGLDAAEGPLHRAARVPLRAAACRPARTRSARWRPSAGCAPFSPGRA